jgi:hypothetical protein
VSGTAPAAAGGLPGAAPGVIRAEAVRRYLAGHRRRRRPSLFAFYTVVLCGAVFGVLGEGVLEAVVGGGLGQREVAQYGPAALALLMLAAVRFGVWQGPVSFRVPDVVLVLLAPLSITSLVRTRLDHALILAAATGAAVGAAVALLASGGVASLGAGRAVAVVVGVTAIGALAVALSWLVEVSADLTRTVARAGPLLVIGALAPLVAAAGREGAAVVAWSGPWGWATQPFTGRPGWPAATALLLAMALTAVSAARRRTRGATPVAFLGRAEIRTGMATAAFVLDYRGVAQHRRGVGGSGAGGWGAGGRAGHFSDGSSEKRPPAPRGFRHLMPAPLTIPRPRSARLAIPWRDALTAVRAPTRFGTAALVMAACVTEAARHPGRGLPAGLAAVGLYAAAALVCEPLRDDVDRPDRGAVLLSRSFASLLLGHCVVPVVILVASGAVTIAVLFLTGVVGPLALLMIPTLLPAATAVAVLSAALATRRGGRIDGDVMGRLSIVDPSSPAFGAVAIVVLAPWLLVSGAVLGVTIALLGRAVTHHDQVVAAGIDVTSVVVIAALVLLRIAWRSPRP